MASTLKAFLLPVGLVAFLASAPGAVAEVITLPDGLQYEDTRVVQCDRPAKVGDTVAVHYRGTLTNGKEFDESYKRGKPFSFQLGQGRVIRGWDEGIPGMCIGTQRTLMIPSQLAYGPNGVGIIAPHSDLIFETELMHIKGVPDPPPIEEAPATTAVPELPAASTTTVAASTTSAAPVASTTPEETAAAVDDDSKANEDSKETTEQPEETSTLASLVEVVAQVENGECRLLGPFALIVQSALGLLALLSLVFKRWRERPRRPAKIWFFDASKQVVGTALLHVANLAMSTISSGSDISSLAAAAVAASKTDDDQSPNPCSFYLLNLAIDTTVGLPILLVMLKLVHAIALRTPLANPPESLKSGYYGQPARATWWLKQSILYFLGLFGMKAFVLFLFSALPWLPWVGDWALRWTEGNESLQIAFVMFIFPLAMNAIQYYIIDAFIKEDNSQGYESVGQDDNSGHDAESEHDHSGEEEEEGPVVQDKTGVEVHEGAESSQASTAVGQPAEDK